MLPRHLTFTASFDADEGDLQKAKHCYCPCSKKSVQWLKLAGRIVPGAEEGMKFKCKNAFYGPKGLMDHLGDGKDPLHCGILAYVKGLYPNYKTT